jgi:hypothetical protein
LERIKLTAKRYSTRPPSRRSNHFLGNYPNSPSSDHALVRLSSSARAKSIFRTWRLGPMGRSIGWARLTPRMPSKADPNRRTAIPRIQRVQSSRRSSSRSLCGLSLIAKSVEVEAIYFDPLSIASGPRQYPLRHSDICGLIHKMLGAAIMRVWQPFKAAGQTFPHTEFSLKAGAVRFPSSRHFQHTIVSKKFQNPIRIVRI